MTIRQAGSGVRGYDPHADLEYQDMLILSMAYVIGFEENDLLSITIDEAIAEIRSTFFYSKNTTPTAGGDIVRSISMLLVLNFRRAWFDRQIARGVIEHG